MIDALLPGFLLIGAGLAAARLGLMTEAAVKALSDVAFHLLLPALLFRSMARTDLGALDFAAPAAYFAAAVPLFLAVVLWTRSRGRGLAEAGVRALACTYSNLVMLGLPMARLVYGERGFTVLLTVVALHSLVMLTLATLVVELDPGRAARAGASSGNLRRAALAGAVRTALLHPVILPIFAGLGWSLTGLGLAGPVDQTLALAGGAAPTLCLLLLGASLSRFDPRVELAGAVAMATVKNLVQPLLAWSLGRWVFGLDATSLAAIVFGAAMPIGANVYLFAQRYGVAMPQVSAGVTLSTAATGVLLVPLLGWLPG
jgi:malonate transporter